MQKKHLVKSNPHSWFKKEALGKLRPENFLNMIKSIYKNPTVNILRAN